MDDDDVPIEISRLAEGALSFVKGGLMNAGMRTWYAIDLERYISVAVRAAPILFPHVFHRQKSCGPTNIYAAPVLAPRIA